MTIIYKHEAPKTDCYDTRRIVVEHLYDGSTDITTIVCPSGNSAAFMNHNLPIAESDKLGAALCKDIIDNCRRHNTHLKDKIFDLEDTISDERYDNTVLRHKNTELEAKNSELEQRINLHNLCFAADPVHCENIGVPVYGMRSKNFERLNKGYHGTLSRHGKTIVITLPFEHEAVAINAGEYITSQDGHTNNNNKDAE